MKETYEEQTDIRYGAARGWLDAIIQPHETRDVLVRLLGYVARPDAAGALSHGRGANLGHAEAFSRRRKCLSSWILDSLNCWPILRSVARLHRDRLRRARHAALRRWRERLLRSGCFPPTRSWAKGQPPSPPRAASKRRQPASKAARTFALRSRAGAVQVDADLSRLPAPRSLRSRPS